MREFTQAGVELIGSPASMPTPRRSSWRLKPAMKSGCRDGNLRINDSRIVDGILAGVGLSGDAIPAAKALMKERNIVGLREFDKPL